MKTVLRLLLRVLWKVEVEGLHHYAEAGERVLVVANHSSFLDAVLLAVFLPGRLTFAVNTWVAARWWVRPVRALVHLFPMDPTNPLSTRALIRHVREGHPAIIFPEGRITVTGSLMKIYDGTGMVADRSGAAVLPVRIDGAQYTPFSRLRGRVRLRWFPPIRLRVLAPRRISPPDTTRGRERRRLAGRLLGDVMREMMFETGDRHRTLFEALLDARRVHGGRHVVVEDIERRPLGYDRLVTRSLAAGALLARLTQRDERVGVLLPSTAGTVVVFMGLQCHARVPAMLNYTAGASGMISACATATLRTVLTSRRFIEAARLDDAAARLAGHVRLVYLEDLVAHAGWRQRLAALLLTPLAHVVHRRARGPRDPHAPAVVLFTSGSEGAPKGVVLSHANLLANGEQLAARIDFNAQDVILNALPLFHSFGLTAGTLLPLFFGMRTFFYPNPLHYRIVPEMAYDVNATVIFGTNTFLAGYARFAHPYDFYAIRHAFAGAEKLQEQTRRTWASKFGVRVLEGYGATETAPVLAANTPMENREGTVGRLLPGIEHRLEPVPGMAEGGRLLVRGPNVMLGYLLAERPGELVPPPDGWYDTGDIVAMDAEGYVRILGRARRFAKVGGEMVSLAAAEELAARAWPAALHAVVSVPDAARGEQLALLTDARDASRAALVAAAREAGIGEINVPRHVLQVNAVPVLGSGKLDYPAASRLVAGMLAG